MVATGKIEPVVGTPMDFTRPKAIGRDLGQLTSLPQGYDCNFVLDRGGRTGLVIAASDHSGVLKEVIALHKQAKPMGHYHDQEGMRTIAYALTPGYETYRGLGWYGVLIQSDPQLAAQSAPAAPAAPAAQRAPA